MSSDRRQRVEKVPGARRAKLTPAAGTAAESVEEVHDAPGSESTTAEASGPNDDRLRRDIPPHY